jgi:hypothetical protein
VAEENVVVSLDRARFIVEMDRLGALRHAAGDAPLYESAPFMSAFVAACDEHGSRTVAEHLGIGKSTASEWVARWKKGITKREAAALRAAPVVKDPELCAIMQCMKSLDTLDQEARHRVLSYLDERYFGTWKEKP